MPRGPAVGAPRRLWLIHAGTCRLDLSLAGLGPVTTETVCPTCIPGPGSGNSSASVLRGRVLPALYLVPPGDSRVKRLGFRFR